MAHGPASQADRWRAEPAANRRPYRATSARQVCATARSWRPTPWHACAVTFHRREVLATLGAASASTLLWALGCGGPAPLVRRAPQVSGEVRTWLRDAVAQLAAVHPFAHALAVSRRRTAAARD